MPMDKSLYPPDWNEISRRIRFDRAKGCCEQCGVRHDSIIIREPGTDLFWYYDPDLLMAQGIVLDKDGIAWAYEELPESVLSDDDWKVTRVILTVHHIGVDKPDGTPGSPHDKSDCREVNLAALCQRCHLLADMSEHVKSRRKTNNRKKHERLSAAGQRSMFNE